MNREGKDIDIVCMKIADSGRLGTLGDHASADLDHAALGAAFAARNHEAHAADRRPTRTIAPRPVNQR